MSIIGGANEALSHVLLLKSFQYRFFREILLASVKEIVFALRSNLEFWSVFTHRPFINTLREKFSKFPEETIQIKSLYFIDTLR